MAEGWARVLKNESIEAYSAGVEKHGMNPFAVKVMGEAGVDMGSHRSKLVEEVPVDFFDYVVTVCSNAHESCPVFPGRAKVVHHGFDDPPRLAKGLNSEEDILAIYRRVRDQIRAYVETLPESLQAGSGTEE